MKLTTEKIIILILGVIVLVLFLKPKQDDSSDYYKARYESSQRVIDSLSNELKTVKQDRIRIKTQINEKDSIIVNADARQLDSLFTGFFNRLK